MTTYPLERLAPPQRVRKRAQYEAFEFELLGTDVRVRNASRADPAEHEYVVSVEAGLPTACTCPADEQYDPPCKHRVAVAIRRPILQIATDVAAVTGDGDIGRPPLRRYEPSM